MRRKLFLSFLVLVLIAIAFTGIISIYFARQSYIDQLEERLENNAAIVAAVIQESPEVIYDKVDQLAKLTGTRVTLVNEEGLVLGDSEAELEGLDNHKFRPEIQAAYKGKVGTSIRYSNSVHSNLFYLAYPYETAEGTQVVRLSVKLVEIDEYNQKMLYAYLFAALIGLLVSVSLSLRFSKAITTPINEVVALTEKIANGQYNEKIYMNYDEELNVLAENFNKMTHNITEKVSELEETNMKTESILRSLVNGVIALDQEMRVTSINPAAIKLLHLEGYDPRGKLLLQIIRNNYVYEKIRKAMGRTEVDSSELEAEVEGRHLHFYLNPLWIDTRRTQTGGALLLMQDVTELKKLEHMRKDFVANVSHELKTPLTSIKGFVETLKNGAIEQEDLRNKFLGIIEIESTRLSTLIDDLLLLSEIEQQERMVAEEFSVREAITEVTEMMSVYAYNKQVELLSDLTIHPEVTLRGKQTWFKQLLINLIDNGIKYNKEEGFVKISARVENFHVIISIRDNGIGIDQSHLERLFERFYRVDKSRSRKVGGTGLGLAIVKHVLKIFEGRIDVKSQPNIGTEFVITIPINPN